MTDTEILDYLQQSLTMNERRPRDVQIGSVYFTTGLRPGTLRQLLEAAILADVDRVVGGVSSELRK